MHTRYRIKQLLLVIGDAASLLIGVFFAVLIRSYSQITLEGLLNALFWFSFLIGIWIIINYINGLYELARHERKHELFARLMQVAIVNAVVGVIYFYILPSTIITPKTILVLSILSGYSLLSIWRLGFMALVKTKALTSRLLFIGNKEEMVELAHMIASKEAHGYLLSAWIEPPQSIKKNEFPETVFYDSRKAIRPSVSVHAIDTVVIAKELKTDSEILAELYELLFWQTSIVSLASLYETITGRIPPYTFSENWFLDHLQHHMHPVYARIRRMVDIICGIGLFAVYILVYPLVALAIRIESKGPIVFRQQRVGMSGAYFSLYKFRSMYALAADGSAEVDGAQFATKDDARITHVGRLLRKTRIDELPQAINLLKGDISIIGPRPERPQIVAALEQEMPYYQVRHLVKPGITGWAQVNQHYTDTMAQSLQKLQYDLYYIKNRSLFLDLSILLKTVNVVFRAMGQ